MSDLVERLRTRDSSLHIGAMCHEAADEIERLRKDVQNLNRDCMSLAEDKERLRHDRDLILNMYERVAHGAVRSE